MKKISRIILCLLLFGYSQHVFPQVTLLSNNTDLTAGIALNGVALMVSENDSLWVTNGTPGGTVKLSNAVAFADTNGAALYGGRLLFAGANSTNGLELWATNATTAGTTLLKDINPGTGSSAPSNFFVFNNLLFFTANNGTTGTELWVSDGTNAGTTLLKDINPGAGSSFNNANNPLFCICNGVLYFVANDGVNGMELWKTNGTAAGTTLVKDITPGIAGTEFSTLTSLGNTLVLGFTSGTGITSVFQLWRSDGISVGTTLVKDFGSFSGFFAPTFFLFNNRLYFNGTDFLTTGTELWVTDATPTGTVLVKDIYPGNNSSSPLLFNAVIINNKFYFMATNDLNGSELWMSDGTGAGTQLLKDINAGTASSSPIIFKNFDNTSGGFSNNTLYNGKVFFSANDGPHGTELWVTDGTAGGTLLVKDILLGTGNGVNESFSYFYTTSGLFFSADNGTSGQEPWLSNGTDAGTARIADVNPGAGSSVPRAMFFYNSQLYFNATNGDDISHTDLFKVDAPLFPLSVALLDFAAAADATNTVDLKWATASEINSARFIVERSVDGTNYVEVGHVNATGNTTRQQEYSLRDQGAAGLHKSILYYRLKLVDKDDTYKYSKVVLVRLKGALLQITLSPNPVKDILNITVRGERDQKTILRITDAAGRVVYQQATVSSGNVYQQSVSVSNWQTGLYQIEYLTATTRNLSSFLKY